MLASCRAFSECSGLHNSPHLPLLGARRTWRRSAGESLIKYHMTDSFGARRSSSICCR